MSVILSIAKNLEGPGGVDEANLVWILHFVRRPAPIQTDSYPVPPTVNSLEGQMTSLFPGNPRILWIFGFYSATPTDF